MSNIITINFDPCEPPPANGYKVTYRPIGDEDFRVHPFNFTESPIEIIDDLDPAGTSYEGYIQGDCGNGQLGVPIPWTAINGDSESEICIPVEFDGAPGSMPNGQVTTPYFFNIELQGTPPFSLNIISKPDWMNIAIVGSQVQFTGTPDETGDDVPVSIEIGNCGPESIEFSDTIDVTPEPITGVFEVTVLVSNITVNDVTLISHNCPMPVVGPDSNSGSWFNFGGGGMAFDITSIGAGTVSVLYDAVFQGSVGFSGSGVAVVPGLPPAPNGTHIEGVISVP